MIRGKVLILSPHMDDEVLGCGGVIAKMMEAYPSLEKHLMIYYFNNHHPMIKKTQFLKENRDFLEVVKCSVHISLYKKVNELENYYPIIRHIAEIEVVINDFKPDTLFIPFPSYNQDHRRVFEAGLTASRPHDENFYVKNVLLYEQPETIQSNRLEPFMPSVFVPINIDKKIKFYLKYKSQLRGHRSIKHVRHLASVRGMQCNAPFAEAFMIIRSTL